MMTRNINTDLGELTVKKSSAESESREIDGAACAGPSPDAALSEALPWSGTLPVSSYGVMAVIDSDGYLVPLWTAGDLLRACKAHWRSTLNSR